MADTTYVVEIKLETTGEADAHAPGLQRSALQADALASRMNQAAVALRGLTGMGPAMLNRLASVMETAAGFAFRLAAGVAAVGAATGVTALTWGVTKLNEEMERTQINLGAIFAAQGQVPTLSAGLELAEDTIAQMRKDAAELPGEFRDLMNIMTTAGIPAFQAGADVTGLRQMSAKLMATGVVASMPLDQVAREAAMLIQGRAGGHNVLGMRLMGLTGESAQEFNKMTGAERLERINSELDKYKDSIAVFATSYEGLSSTAVDNAKRWLEIASKPLFERVKDTLADINRWFDDNEQQIIGWANLLGDRLAKAWDWGRQKFQEWQPLVLNFALGLYERLSAVWDKVTPAATRFADAIKEALADPEGTIDKLITLAKLWAALRITGAAAGLVQGLGMGAFQIMAGVSPLLAGGGAAAAGGAGAAAGAGAAGGAATWTAAGLGAALGGLAITAGSVAAALTGVGLAAWQGYELWKDLQGRGDEEMAANERAVREWADRTVDAAMKYEDGQERVNEMIMRFRDAGERGKASALALALSMDNAAHSITRSASWIAEKAALVRVRERMFWDPTQTAIELGLQRAPMGFEERMKLQAQLLEKGKKHTPHSRGGGGGARIQKVEIVVTSNQAPSRVARMVTDEIAKLGRLRKSSPYVTNYSALTRPSMGG